MDSQELQPGKEVSSTYEVENVFYDFLPTISRPIGTHIIDKIASLYPA